jgi:hypothetical protein
MLNFIINSRSIIDNEMKIIYKEITNIFIDYEVISMMYISSLHSNIAMDLPIILEFYTTIDIVL